MGPKLYEESWIELTKQGYLARVKCIEIRVKMTDLYMEEYLHGKDNMKKNYKKNLYTGNPNKFRILQYLIKYHKRENHKILVFSDTLGKIPEFLKKRDTQRVCKGLRVSLYRLGSQSL